MEIKDDKELELATQALVTIENAEALPVPTPLEEVESSLSDFVKQAFGVALSSTALQSALEKDFIENLSEMKTDEKIALFNIERTTANDRLFKLLSPTFGLMTSKQHAEIQAANKREAAAAVQVNVGTGPSPKDAKVANETDPAVISGLNSLFQLSQVLQKQQESKPSE